MANDFNPESVISLESPIRRTLLLQDIRKNFEFEKGSRDSNKK